jgi:hypothetical protein
MTEVISSLEVLSLQRAATTGNIVPFASRPIKVHKYYIHQSHIFQEPLAYPVNFDFVIWFNTGAVVSNIRSLSRLTIRDLILYSVRISLYKASIKLVPGPSPTT